MQWSSSYPSTVVKDTENCVDPHQPNNFASLHQPITLLLWNIYALVRWISCVCISYPWYFLLHWNTQSCVFVQLSAAGLRSPSTTQLCFSPTPASGGSKTSAALTGNTGKEAKESSNPVSVLHISRMSLKTKFCNQVSVLLSEADFSLHPLSQSSPALVSFHVITLNYILKSSVYKSSNHHC